MVQEPYEGEKYPSVDDIAPPQFNSNDQYRRREPKSPSFKGEEPTRSLPNPPETKPTPSNTGLSYHTKSETTDFVKQLMGKIKKQAEQLMQLENYKILCERRIRELAPSHPVPIDPSQLGNSKPGHIELIV